jgi:ribonuclease HII
MTPRQPVVLHVGPLGLCGVDEAGRGPLAGPVTAAAVMLDPERPIDGLRDSKKLSAAARERLADAIRERAAAWCVAEASVAEIDQLNILHATLLAMQRAVAGLGRAPDDVMGRRQPLSRLGVALAGGGQGRRQGGGDRRRVDSRQDRARRSSCANCTKNIPAYGFARHMGYGTAVHLAALKAHGACPQHRRQLRPGQTRARPSPFRPPRLLKGTGA